MTAYDVIGDVHGCADTLEALLRELGYRKRWRTWRHPSRQAVFVGDLIDRGPQQVKTVTLVRRMVDAGAAQITMGNHEFNAVAWMTPDARNPGDFLRPRNGTKGARNREQHAAFLAQVGEDSRLHREFVGWFRTLPMHLDLGELRVVHACWHEDSLDLLRAAEAQGGLTDEFLAAAHDRSGHGSPEYRAIETVLKGPELDVPHAYLDKEGHARDRARLRWWDDSASTLRDLAEIPRGCTTPTGDAYPDLPDSPSAEAEPYRYRADTPVVFGHYWRRHGATVTEPKAVCVDLSAVRGGHLAAYRFDGEPVINAAKLVAVPAPAL